MGRASKAKLAAVTELLKLDFGCGPNKREGFLGVDQTAFAGVDLLCDLTSPSPSGRWLLGPTNKDADLGPLKRSNVLEWPALIGHDAYELPDNSVSEAHASHFVEHLTAWQRVHFWNELYRVLVPNGTAQIIVPHWASCRAYGDPTHQWPPVSEFAFYYIKKDWRMANAPHCDSSVRPDGFNCDLEAVWGNGMRPDIAARNPEFQQFAMANYKEAITDLYVTVKALKG